MSEPQAVCGTCKGSRTVPSGAWMFPGVTAHEPCSACGDKMSCANHPERSVVMGTRAAEGWSERRGPRSSLPIVRIASFCPDCTREGKTFDPGHVRQVGLIPNKTVSVEEFIKLLGSPPQGAK